MSTTSDDARTTPDEPIDLAPEGIAPDPLLAVDVEERIEATTSPTVRVSGGNKSWIADVDEQAEVTSEQPPKVIAPDPLPSLSAPTEPKLETQNSKLKTALAILRWALGGLSLLAAFWGQALAEEARRAGQGAPPQMSWIMFGAAGLLFAIAMWPVSRVPAAISSTFFKTLRSFSLTRKLRFLLPLGLSIILGLIAIPLFLSLNSAPEQAKADWWTNTGSWLLYIAAILLFAFAFIVWERSAPPTYSAETPPPGDRLPRRLEWVIMGALLLLALLLRVPGLENAPPGLYFDEAQNGVVARQITAPDALHPTFIADKSQMGALNFYFLGIVLKIFGGDVWPLRILMAVGGALIAPILYLLGARLYGWRVGLAAGGLVAVSAWNITFSRLGFFSMFTVALDVAVYLCAAQALRTGRLGYYAGAGILLGLAMQGYYMARLVPVVLIAVLLHRLLSERLRLLKSLRAGALVLVVSALLAFMPAGLFALQQPDVYNARVNEVSIFGGGGGGDPRAFERSLNAHALMFNFSGDRNGRHNLPGTPMLDWLVAALFFAGLAACILRAWRWQYFFPVVWLAAAVSGGVLSLLFEAPQAHRALEASVVVCLIGGIFLGELWHLLTRAWSPTPAAIPNTDEGRPLLLRALRRRKAALVTPTPTHIEPAPAPTTLPTRKPAATHPASTLPVRQHPARKADTPPADTQPQPPPPVPSPVPTPAPSPIFRVPIRPKQIAAVTLSMLGIIAAVSWSGVANAQKYFNAHLRDHSVWKEMYAAEAEAGRVFARFKDTHDVYITPIYHSLPPSKYLVPDREALGWPGMHAVPFPPTASRDIVALLDPPSAGDLSLISRIYPNSRFEVLQTPDDPTPLVYTIIIPASDINAIQGVRATINGTTSPPRDTTLPTMDFNWSAQGANAGTVRLSSTFRADRYGPHSFQLQTAGGTSASPSSVRVDGFEVGAGTPITLGVGIHSIVLTDTLTSGGSGVTKLLWSPPGSSPQEIPSAFLLDPRKVEPRGLTGVFRQGTDFLSPPREGRLEPVISAYFHNTPLPRPYTAEWSGRLYIPVSGSYTFGSEQLSRSVLYIDHKEVISNLHGNNLLENIVILEQGWHSIRVRYEDYEGYSHIYLYWTPPGKTRTILPSAFLWPDMGSYPEQPESGSFPTLDDFSGTRLPPERVSGAHLPLDSPTPRTNPQPNLPPANPPPQPQLEGTPIEPLYTIGTAAQGGQAGPFSVAADPAGNIYIFSVTDSHIRKYDSSGSRLAEWPALAADSKPLTEISAMLVHSDTLLALDAERSELLTFGLDGTLLDRRRMCDCYFPRGLSLSRDGHFWVGDTGGGKVLKVSANGQIIFLLGDRGSEPGKFIDPVSLWETPSGILYVADIGNNRVQSFRPDGQPLAQWSIGSSNARDGNRLAGDGENVLVTDGESRTITRYDSQGQQLGRWSIARNGEVLVPSDIASMGNGGFAVLYLKNELALAFKP
jgi:hypothetical protein